MSASAPRYRATAGWLISESAFGVVDSADGSGYTAAPLEKLEVTDNLEVLPTEYSTGEEFATDSERGADGATVTFESYLIGLAAAAGDGTAGDSGAADWLHILFANALGATEAVPGEGVASSGNTALTLDTDALDVQDLVCVHEDDLPSAANERSQWAFIETDSTGGVYVTAPQWTSNPTGAAVAYGHRDYIYSSGAAGTLGMVVQKDAVFYRLSGGRVTKLVIKGEDKKAVRVQYEIKFDSISEATSALTALPAQVRTTPTPIKLFSSPVWFNGTAVATKSVEIDFGIMAGEVADSAGANGRSGMELIEVKPTVRIEPRATDAQRLAWRAGTAGRMLIQLGAGRLSGGVLNSVAVFFHRMQANEFSWVDDAGHLRNGLQFMMTKNRLHASGVVALPYRVSRA